MRKLYDALVKSGQYSKSFEEFKKQFNNKEGSKKLHNALNKDGQYSKSFEEFETQFEFKVPSNNIKEKVEEVKKVQTPPSLSSDTISLLDNNIPVTADSRVDILKETEIPSSLSVETNKPLISRDEFDNISEEDLVKKLRDRYRKLGYDIRQANIGQDAISVTNIATDQQIKIPLQTDYNQQNQIMDPYGQQPDSTLLNEAYNKFIEFTSPKINSNEVNTFNLTNLKPSEYFSKIKKGIKGPSPSSLYPHDDPDEKYNAEQMNILANVAKNKFIEVFMDPALVNLQRGKNASLSAAADYDDKEIAKIQQWAYEQTVLETGINISKYDFDSLYEYNNIIGRLKPEAEAKQQIKNDIILAANNDLEKETQLKNAILTNKTAKRNQFDQAAFSLINGSKIDGIETGGLYTVEDKIREVEEKLLQGPPDDTKGNEWILAQEKNLEELKLLKSSIIQDLTTNAKAAAEHFAKDEAIKRIMSSPYYASRGELNFTDPEYQKDYTKYFKEYSSRNYIDGISASDRKEIREQNKSTSYNEGFNNTLNNLATNINELSRENSSLTERQGKQELMKINVRRYANILENGKQTVTLKAKKVIGGDDRLPLEQLRQAGYMPNENGEIIVPINVLMGIKAKTGEIGEEIMGYQSFEGWFDKFFLERGNAINKEDLNALKMHAKNVDNVNGSIDALYETLYLNKDIADLEKTGTGEIFLRNAIKETLKTVGYSGEKVNRMLKSSEGKLDTRTLFDHVSNVSADYNESFAQLIKDGKVPPAQFTEDQIKQIERTFGEEFVEMAGGFVPLLGQIMALSAA